MCGHQYCTYCVRLWWRAHRTCPICKKPLRLKDFHEITYKPQELVAQEESSVGFDHDRHSQNTIYSGLSSGVFNKIKNIDLDDSFGTKVDSLARHIVWLREHDPGAQSIVFSQYKHFVDILQRSFHRFGITVANVDTPGGIENFKDSAVSDCTRKIGLIVAG